MKILSAAQTRALDQATIQDEGIMSLELMERAATAFTEWLLNRLSAGREVHIFCGPGNNGGDGLAAARLLHQAGQPVRVWLLPAARDSADFTANRHRLPPEVPCAELNTRSLPELPASAVVVDALFGTGLSRPLTDEAATVVQHINHSAASIVAVDMPSGLLTDAPQPAGSVVVRARYTVSFELPKLAFFLPQNAEFVGLWEVLPIGLDEGLIHNTPVDNHTIDLKLLTNRLPARQKFGHKGTYGHALLLAGSYGKVGAAVLAARACLHGGVGLLTLGVPTVGYDIVQTAVPEAMALPGIGQEHVTSLPDLAPYSAVGIGPGLGQHDDSHAALEKLLRTATVPLVLDADALNLLGANRALLDLLPPDAILTPHPREFERLTQPACHDYHRLELLRAFCHRHQCYVVLKGAHTCVGTPAGDLYFNTTGNAGMATGGSGDVLTGLLTALRAQKLSALDACLVGVYAHGRAGDLAAQQLGEMGLAAGDIVTHLGPALQKLVTPSGF
ncbi:NAD(P)H-hydrate dehydratase [Hymenobacter guriensis]|uniref:Bifunctional NAD(P)H-hydrate repair enzyme n=1 Tax=Hymenobacter guriensis TaxID=2793065 RepID=A0ABS0KZI5_9BACT|nr:NAD(P)H-hydrate dehydratase [Hymenobacter guriensis]MBG8553218.1 NAD(P)H-hydrate dehydratase [Hymenobacter guriensis]